MALPALRGQLALQGVYVVSTAEKAVLVAMAAISDADLNSCFLSYIRPGLMAACEAEFAHRESRRTSAKNPSCVMASPHAPAATSTSTIESVEPGQVDSNEVIDDSCELSPRARRDREDLQSPLFYELRGVSVVAVR